MITDRITIDPAILHGQPCIRGMRYPVALIVSLVVSGTTVDEILADYPDLERDDVLAALAYQLADFEAAIHESRQRGYKAGMALDCTALEMFRQMDIPLRRVLEKYRKDV